MVIPSLILSNCILPNRSIVKRLPLLPMHRIMSAIANTSDNYQVGPNLTHNPYVCPTISIYDGKRFPVRRVHLIGRNYTAHAIELGNDPREPPFFFQKWAGAVVDASGDSTVVPLPRGTDDYHYEAEVVVLVTSKMRDVDVDAATRGIGYVGVGIDFTRRDRQNEAKAMKRPWCDSKSVDMSAPVGSFVPYGEAWRAGDAELWLEVNGERKQGTTFGHMIHSPSEAVAWISKMHDLHPGDVVFTGTPAGVSSVQVGDCVSVFASNGKETVKCEVVMGNESDL